jgi:hypothetical protein
MRPRGRDRKLAIDVARRVGTLEQGDFNPDQRRTKDRADGAGTLCSLGIQAGNLGGPYRYLPLAKGGFNSLASQGQDVISWTLIPNDRFL